ncbi:YciC family protein [Neptunomonas marina]|uniref:DUF975 family protein n=1 Tax=Neptunomonas marina TaxID=1815562 RepID=A0A437QD55_9GAMM|nr:YciC family protein [Neptunomonas marina]RVU32464.1 hypothetical protein EOE65_02105 [Neptunomonas marina]
MSALNTLDLLKQTFFFFRRNLAAIAAIQLPFLIALNLLASWIESNAGESTDLSQQMAYLALLRLTLLPIFWGATILYIQSKVDGNDYSPSQAVFASLRFWRSLLLVFLLSGMAIFTGLMFFIIPGIYIGVRLAFADFICVVERKPVFESLKQSWEDTKDYFWLLLQGLLILYPGLQIAELYFAQTFAGDGGSNWLLELVIFVTLDLLSVLALIYGFRVYCVMRDEQRPEDRISNPDNDSNQ